MRSTILVVGLVVGPLAVCGCGKKDAAGATGAVEFEVKGAEIISDTYRDDPAAAEAKYKVKVGRVPFAGNFEREDGKTVGRFSRAGVVRSARQPDLLFRFTDAEAARIDKRKGYYLVGRCEGLVDGVVLFTNCRTDGEHAR
jgi:hypothetical protein